MKTPGRGEGPEQSQVRRRLLAVDSFKQGQPSDENGEGWSAANCQLASGLPLRKRSGRGEEAAREREG